MSRNLPVACIALFIFSSACARIGVKDEMFSQAPIWETKQLAALHPKHDPASTTETKILASEAPGLALLTEQVLGVNSIDKANLSTKFSTASPFSKELASDPVIKVIIQTMGVIYSEARGLHADLPETTLSPDAIKEFSEKAIRQAYGVFGPPTEKSSIEDRSAQLSKAIKDEKIDFDRILWTYLKGYYNDSFIDRTGGVLKKPKIGLTITNESLTSFLTVFLEAVHDFAIVESSVFKVPVLYVINSEGVIEWVNVNKSKPTFAGFFPDATTASPNIELLQIAYDKPGITKEKLEYINYAAGLAGENSQALSGALVRLFGGANLGFVFMGKFSFGDNETLSKLVDTFVEVNVRRFTATATSSILYPIPLPENTPIPSK